MTERAQWPKATADLFVDAAGIAAYIDGEGTDPATATTDYRREMAELQADTSPGAQLLLAECLKDQHGAVTAWLDALVHLGAARWESYGDASIRRRLVIYGPPES